MEWPTARLSELCNVTIGATPARSRPEYWAGEYPWVTVSELNGGVLTDTKERITDLGVANSSSKLIRAGTLLFSFKLSIGKMAFAGVDLYTNEAIAALPIRDTRVLSARYLYYSLLSGDTLAPVNVAAKGRLLNKVALQNFRIPLPPLSEQCRIVEILDQADRLRRLRTEADAKTDRLHRILFMKMFGNPDTAWDVARLGDLLRRKKGALQSGPFGTHLHNHDFTPSGAVLAVGIDNVLDGEFVLGRNRLITLEKYNELRKYTLERGDVLITIMGTVGRTCVFPGTASPSICTKHVYRIQLDKAVDPEYLSATLRFSERVRAQLGAGVAGQIVAGIKSGDLRRLQLSVPPIELQVAFATRKGEIDAIRRRARNARDESEALFSLLVHRAFTGTLTASWREAHLGELVQEMEQQAKLLS